MINKLSRINTEKHSNTHHNQIAKKENAVIKRRH